MLSNFVKDKAREISYALIRVAFYVKRSDLRSRLESLALELLENSSRVNAENNSENINKALSSVSVLDSLVRLGHSIYEIEPVNATILVRELDNLNSAIRQSGNSNEALPDLETFFQIKNNHISEQVRHESNNLKKEVADKLTNDGSVGLESESLLNSSNNGLNSAIRQAAIINRIKSSNGSASSPQAGCRLKDLLAEFSDVSERTLRYDLQRLCEKGAIERVGNGGPASYYRSAEAPRSMVISETGAKLRG